MVRVDEIGGVRLVPEPWYLRITKIGLEPGLLRRSNPIPPGRPSSVRVLQPVTWGRRNGKEAAKAVITRIHHTDVLFLGGDFMYTLVP